MNTLQNKINNLPEKSFQVLAAAIKVISYNESDCEFEDIKVEGLNDHAIAGCLSHLTDFLDSEDLEDTGSGQGHLITLNWNYNVYQIQEAINTRLTETAESTETAETTNKPNGDEMNNELKLLTLKDWVSITKLASHVKLDRTYVSQILNGHKKVNASRASEIAHACNMFTHRIDLYKASDFCDDVPKTSAETERSQLIDLIVSSIATLDDLNSQADENATPTLKNFETIKELSDKVNNLRGVEL